MIIGSKILLGGGRLNPCGILKTANFSLGEITETSWKDISGNENHFDLKGSWAFDFKLENTIDLGQIGLTITDYVAEIGTTPQITGQLLTVDVAGWVAYVEFSNGDYLKIQRGEGNIAWNSYDEPFEIEGDVQWVTQNDIAINLKDGFSKNIIFQDVFNSLPVMIGKSWYYKNNSELHPNNINIVCDGDSITEGTSCGGTAYPELLKNDLSSKYQQLIIYNRALGGTTTQQMIDRYPEYVSDIYDNEKDNYYILMSGTNDIWTLTAQEIYDKQVVLFGIAKAQGYTTIQLTPTVNKLELAESILSELTSLILANPIADVTIDTRNFLTDPNDLTYFCDGVHPTEVGRQLIVDNLINNYFNNELIDDYSTTSLKVSNNKYITLNSRNVYRVPIADIGTQDFEIEISVFGDKTYTSVPYLLYSGTGTGTEGFLTIVKDANNKVVLTIKDLNGNTIVSDAKTTMYENQYNDFLLKKEGNYLYYIAESSFLKVYIPDFPDYYINSDDFRIFYGEFNPVRFKLNFGADTFDYDFRINEGNVISDLTGNKADITLSNYEYLFNDSVKPYFQDVDGFKDVGNVLLQPVGNKFLFVESARYNLNWYFDESTPLPIAYNDILNYVTNPQVIIDNNLIKQMAFVAKGYIPASKLNLGYDVLGNPLTNPSIKNGHNNAETTVTPPDDEVLKNNDDGLLFTAGVPNDLTFGQIVNSGKAYVNVVDSEKDKRQFTQYDRVLTDKEQSKQDKCFLKSNSLPIGMTWVINEETGMYVINEITGEYIYNDKI